MNESPKAQSVDQDPPEPGRNRGLRTLGLITWNLIFFLVLIEVLALAAYFARTKTLFYTNPPIGKTIPRGQNQIATYRIHPYFGFMIRPDAIAGVNTSHQRGVV